MAKDPIKARLDQIAKENEEQLARAENVQPTPTQEENDRAALGLSSLEQLDNKEADGSEEQPEGTGSPLKNPIAPAPSGGSDGDADKRSAGRASEKK